MANGKELINYKNALEEALKAQFNDMTILVFDDMDENTQLPAIVVDKPVLETTFQNVASKTNFTTTMIVSVYVVYSAAEENSADIITVADMVDKFDAAMKDTVAMTKANMETAADMKKIVSDYKTSDTENKPDR